MNPIEDGAPFFFATGAAPTATAIDDDIYLTVTTAAPDAPGEAVAIDIILSIEAAKRAVAELQRAIAAVRFVSD